MLNDNNMLIELASEVRKYAKAPYSGFMVGAALLSADGKVYTGVNVESSSYGLTICAERVALTKALSEGALHFKKIAVVVDTETLTPPCGACRQLLYDYAPEIEVIISNNHGQMKVFKLTDLFPEPFGADFLD